MFFQKRPRRRFASLVPRPRFSTAADGLHHRCMESAGNLLLNELSSAVTVVLLHGISDATNCLLLRVDSEVTRLVFSMFISCLLSLAHLSSALLHLLHVYPVAYTVASCWVLPNSQSNLTRCAVHALEHRVPNVLLSSTLQTFIPHFMTTG